uniref:Uncharacterized protein n=1 Tax=Arundo donax TaxID=35708 RepID=A0A0A9CUF9_ARUDO
MRHRRRHHRVHHHVTRDHVHGQVEVSQEARQVLLRVPYQDRIDRPGPFDPSWQGVLDAGDDAGPHDDDGDVAPELPHHHLSQSFGENVRVGPSKLSSSVQAKLFHGLPLVLLRVVLRQLLLGIPCQPQLRLDVQLRSRSLPQGLTLPERPLLDQPLLLPNHISCGNMEDHLEIGALLGQLAHMLHSHHIHIQRHIIPLVEVGGGSSIDDDVEVLSHLCQLGPLHTEILIDDVSSQRNDLVFDEGLEPFAMLLPQKPKQLLPDHISNKIDDVLSIEFLLLGKGPQ